MKPASRLAIQIPATRARLVPRSHLQQLIDTALHRDRCVTPLFTLAGFGKTTLPVEWIHLARDNTVAVTRWVGRPQNVTDFRCNVDTACNGLMLARQYITSWRQRLEPR